MRRRAASDRSRSDRCQAALRIHRAAYLKNSGQVPYPRRFVRAFRQHSAFAARHARDASAKVPCSIRPYLKPRSDVQRLRFPPALRQGPRAAAPHPDGAPHRWGVPPRPVLPSAKAAPAPPGFPEKIPATAPPCIFIVSPPRSRLKASETAYFRRKTSVSPQNLASPEKRSYPWHTEK